MKYWIPLCALLLVQARCQPVRPHGYLMRMAIEMQGHRGCRGLMPENTWPAMEKALELGVSTLEMDVVITRDSVMVLSHEPWFDKTICAIDPRQSKPNIFGMTAQEVSYYDCGSLPHPDFPDQEQVSAPKPTLLEVVEKINAWCAKHRRIHPGLNIEIKSKKSWDNKYHPAPEEYARLFVPTYIRLNYLGPITVSSFDERLLQELHEQTPQMHLGYITSDPLDNPKKVVEKLGFAPAVYSPQFKLINGNTAAECYNLGMRLIVWTVNKEEDMRSMLGQYLDGIITDYPDRLMRLSKELDVPIR